MHIGQIVLLIAVFSFSLPVTAGKVYKIIDEKTGHITFTDKPPATPQQATIDPVDLPPINSQPAIDIPKPSAKTENAQVTGYASIEVAQPKDQSTIPPGQLNLIIQLQTKPQLQLGHSIQLYYHNRKYGKPTSATSFEINQLQRGAHNISADILNADGKILKSSQTITVHVKRNTIIN